MGANYSITPRPTGTIITQAIYDGDHQNHIDNAVPAKFDDYSSSAAEMRLTTDPGEQGSESLATSLAGEIERLRHQIKEIKENLNGGTAIAQWYSSLTKNFAVLNNANGYVKFPNGIIIQWGRGSGTTTTTTTVGSLQGFAFTYPIAFPTTVFSIIGSPDQTGGQSEPYEHSFSIQSTGLTTGLVTIGRLFGAGGPGELMQFNYIVIGN